jgi:predicted anti-sigma-YlaC factor YlaD
MLSSFVDGELYGEERSLVEHHIQKCPECERRVAELEVITQGVRSAASVSLPASFASDVLRAIRLSTDESKGWILAEFMARRVLVGLSLVVLLAFGFTSLSKSDPPVTVERYLKGETSDSSESQILMNGGEISQDDVLLAAVSKH